LSDEDDEQEEEEDENDEGLELFENDNEGGDAEAALRRISNHRSQMQNLFNRISQDADQMGDIESMIMGMNSRLNLGGGRGFGDNDLIIQQPEDNDNPFANINIHR